MRLLSILFTTLITFTNITYADDKNAWVEISLGGGSDFIGTNINAKYGDDISNWAVELGGYSGRNLFSHIEDRSNEAHDVHVGVTTLGLTKNWNKIMKWGYTEAGIGLGVAKGTWAKNCKTVKEPSQPYSLFSNSYDVCDISDGIRLGVPIHATAVFGKYLGIGITAKAFITSEGLHAGLMLTIPLGDFTN